MRRPPTPRRASSTSPSRARSRRRAAESRRRGAFQGWVGIAAGVETLSPVEPVTLAAGDVEASWSDDCLDYQLASLSGTLDGETRTAPTGESVGFGEVALYSAGVVIATNPQCSETMGGYAGAATWSFPR